MEEVTEDFSKLMERLVHGDEYPRDFTMPRTDDEVHGC